MPGRAQYRGQDALVVVGRPAGHEMDREAGDQELRSPEPEGGDEALVPVAAVASEEGAHPGQAEEARDGAWLPVSIRISP